VHRPRERIAAQKVASVFTEHCGPRCAWLPHRPLDRPAPHCGHDTGRHVLDSVCPENLRIYCEMCAVDHYAQPASLHTDPRILKCIVCGSVEPLGPIIVPVRLLGPVPAEGGIILRGGVETEPLAWECPMHDGFGSGELIMGDQAMEW
jgi:hypothetical protein